MKNKPIIIVVHRGMVESVKNLPRGYEYEIVDLDMPCEEDESGSPESV